MQFDLFNYFPDAHYRRAVEEAGYSLDEEPALRSDGGVSDIHNGKRTAKVYYWLDPETGSALEHTGVNDEQTIPFFPDEESAQAYLERQADTGDTDEYEKYSLYQARAKKVGDAVDVLTDQSGIDEFMPDGGYPVDDDGLQVADPDETDRLWFWYNPAGDHIVQEEVEPYDVRALFASEDDAYRFADWYAERYGLDDTAHLELYSAAVAYEGQGRGHVPEGKPGENCDPPEQADLDAYTDTDSNDDVVPDGGLDYAELGKIKLTRAFNDPVITHAPTREFAPPQEDEIYDDVTEARLVNVSRAAVDEPVTQVPWPETVMYLHTVSFDGKYNTPVLERVYRESLRQYVAEWTDIELAAYSDTPPLEDPELSPEFEERLDAVRHGVKTAQDRFFLEYAYDEIVESIPRSFWEDDGDRSLSEVMHPFES